MKLVYFMFIILFVSCTESEVVKRKKTTLEMMDGRQYIIDEIAGSLDKSLDLTIGGIIIEKSTFDDVEMLFGASKKNVSGDAANSMTSVCYEGKDIGVEFISGEMDGGIIISRIDVYRTDLKSDTNCIKTDIDNKKLQNKRGVKIGLLKKEILSLFGVPSIKYTENEWEFYYSDKKNRGKCPGGFDVTGSYKFYFKEDKVVHFYVVQTTSC